MMREKLLKILNRAFKTFSVTPQSAQTSPAKSEYNLLVTERERDLWNNSPDNFVSLSLWKYKQEARKRQEGEGKATA